VVKGFCTETAVEVASLGLQVHGGMGYIEETGAAQHYRDARILPIYEGTTAIQANDLIGRKVLRDGGQTAYAMLEEMADTVAALDAAAARASAPEAPAWALLSANLRQAMQAQRESLDFILSTAPTDPRAAYAGSVPFLMLTGVLHGGWQMARAALACAAPGRADSPFHSAKRATAFFYGAVILPRALGYAASIRAGEVVRHCADAAGLA